MSIIRFYKIQGLFNLWISYHTWFNSYSIDGRLSDHVLSTNSPLRRLYVTPTWDTVWNKSAADKAKIWGYKKACIRLGKDSKEEMSDVYGNKCITLRQVCRWVSKLKKWPNRP